MFEQCQPPIGATRSSPDQARSGPRTPTTAAQRVLDALGATDTPDPPPDLFADGAVTWHSFDEVEEPTLIHAIATLRVIRAVIPDFTMSDVRATGDDQQTGLARYVLTGTLPDGSRLRAPAAMVIHLEDGRVTRLEEYVDTAQLAPLFAALGQASRRRIRTTVIVIPMTT